MKLRLGTGSTNLMLARGNRIKEALEEHGHEVELVEVWQDDDPGSSGAQELSQALRKSLLDGDCDVAMHALEHLPVEEAPGLDVVAIPLRGDWREAFIGLHGMPLSGLNYGTKIGTSSPLRRAQLHNIRPDLEFIDIRGEVAERVARVAEGDLDGIVASAEALDVVGLKDRVTEYLDIIPAIGQGALALECRVEDTDVCEAVRVLDDQETRVCIMAERAVLRGTMDFTDRPVGAIARRTGVLNLKGGAFSFDGAQRIVVELGIPTSEYHAVKIGGTVAQALRERGADTL